MNGIAQDSPLFPDNQTGVSFKSSIVHGLYNTGMPSEVGGTREVEEAEKPPSTSLLQKFISKITYRRGLQFACISMLILQAFVFAPGLLSAIMIFQGSLMLVIAGEFPNKPMFSWGPSGSEVGSPVHRSES